MATDASTRENGTQTDADSTRTGPERPQTDGESTQADAENAAQTDTETTSTAWERQTQKDKTGATETATTTHTRTGETAALEMRDPRSHHPLHAATHALATLIATTDTSTRGTTAQTKGVAKQHRETRGTQPRKGATRERKKGDGEMREKERKEREREQKERETRESEAAAREDITMQFPARKTREKAMHTKGTERQTHEGTTQTKDTGTHIREMARQSVKETARLQTHTPAVHRPVHLTDSHTHTHAVQLGNATDTTNAEREDIPEEQGREMRKEIMEQPSAEQATKQRTQRKLDWADQVEHEYGNRTPPPPTIPRDLSGLRSDVSSPWTSLRRRDRRPTHPQPTPSFPFFPQHRRLLTTTHSTTGLLATTYGTSYRFRTRRRAENTANRISVWMTENWRMREIQYARRVRARVSLRGGTWSRCSCSSGVGQRPGPGPRYSQ
jgi:hypothetical protein